MSVTTVMMPASLNSAATSDARRTLSPRSWLALGLGLGFGLGFGFGFGFGFGLGFGLARRSSAEKPRSRVRPVRRLSPSGDVGRYREVEGHIGGVGR